jgi:hypothetical protein
MHVKVLRHGVVARMPQDTFGYFGWPSVAALPDGTVAAVSSGLRCQHICPWGKTVIHLSRDGGRTWQPPRILNDTPVDDRDAGIVALGDDRLLVTMFAVDSRMYREGFARRYAEHPEEARAMVREVGGWDDATVSAWVGSWVMLGRLGQLDPWPMYRAPVSSPHGPTLLQNGDLLYLGKHCGLPPHFDMGSGTIRTARSTDGGRSWTVEAQIPLAPGMEGGNVHEPHLTQLPDGTLVAMIRYEYRAGPPTTMRTFPPLSADQRTEAKPFPPWRMCAMALRPTCSGTGAC